MTRDEHFLRYWKLQYLLRLITAPRFPASFLKDADLRDVLQGIWPSEIELSEWKYLTVLDENDEEDGAVNYRNFRASGDRKYRKYVAPIAASLSRTLERGGARAARAPLAGKLDALATLFQLDAAEATLLRYFTVCMLEDAFADVVQDVALARLHHNYSRFLARLLQLKVHQVAHRLSPSGRLLRHRILESRHGVARGTSPLSLVDTLRHLFSDPRIKAERLAESIIAPEPPAELAQEDFAHLRDDLRLIVQLLEDAWRQRRKSTNVLLYGEPGLGKTQFARRVTAIAGGRAFGAPRTNDEGDTASASERRLAYEVFQRLCRGERRAVLIVDEAESVLETPPLAWLFGDGNRKGQGDNKAWLTQALEDNPLPVIWIVNEERGIPPAVRRRFTASVHFPELPPGALERSWRHALRRAGPRFNLPEATVRDLASRYELGPGHIAQAVGAWRRATGRHKSEPATLHHVIGQTLRLCMGKAAGTDRLRSLDTAFDTSLLALDSGFDVDALRRAVYRFYEGLVAGGHATEPALNQLSLLFHGPSGAGKTELAKHLASGVGRRLQVERMSDLLSMWVGATEQNIARAFERASRTESILLLDEFDSLAYDRGQAHRSWEVSQTNELLQQIENFRGVLIACTNLTELLDPAIARRFSHKVGFAPIPAERRAPAVATYFAGQLSRGGLDNIQRSRLASLPALYPGDLRAVRQRFAADALLGDPPDAEAIVAALEHEAGFRKEPRRIGFVEGSRGAP